MSTQYARAVESCPDGRRSVNVTGRSGGLFTHGNRSHWHAGITPPMLNAAAEAAKPARLHYIPVVAAARPMRDMADPKVKIVRPARADVPVYCGRGCPVGTLAHAGDCW